VTDVTLTLLSDPQTSGGLLIGFARDETAAAMVRLHDAGLEARVIGEVSPGSGRIALGGTQRATARG